MNRVAVIHLAILAGNDQEYGYDADAARQGLRNVDPDYDWEPELLQLELEHGYRTMGPKPLQPYSRVSLAGVDGLLKDFYEDYITGRVSQHNSLIDLFVSKD